MEIATLAAKQKRLRDWTEFLEQGVADADVKERSRASLARLKEVLYQCWQNGAVSEAQQFEIADLERELEQLTEEARLNPSSHSVITKRLTSAQA